MPGADAGLVLEHAREMEAHDLAARLGDVVVGGDAGRLADDESGGRRARRCVGRPFRGRAWAESWRLGLRRRSRRRPAASAASSLLVSARCEARLAHRGRSPSASSSPFVALHELGFELDEAVDDAATVTTSTSSRLSSTRRPGST